MGIHIFLLFIYTFIHIYFIYNNNFSHIRNYNIATYICIHTHIHTYIHKSIHMSAIIFHRLSHFVCTVNKFLTPILVSAYCIVNILCFDLLPFLLFIFVNCFLTGNTNTKSKSKLKTDTFYLRLMQKKRN